LKEVNARDGKFEDLGKWFNQNKAANILINNPTADSAGQGVVTELGVFASGVKKR
jgi:hypothetical protein